MDQIKLEEIRVDVTRKCNLACGYCYNKNRGIKKEIPTEDTEKLISDALPLGLARISFTGGEPMLEYERLIDLIGYCKNNGVETLLLTNATLIDPKRAKEMAEAGLDSARVSLDGGSSRVNARTRGKSFKDAVCGIHNLKNADIRVTLRPTVTKKNFMDLRELAGLTVKLNVDRMEFQRYLIQGNPTMDAEYALLLGEYEKAVSELLKLKKEYEDAVEFILYSNWYEFTQPEFRGDTYKTNNAFSYLHVDSGGFIAPGACDGNKIGNIKSAGFSLRRFWLENSLLKEMREHKAYGVCGRCTYHSVCYPTLSPTSNLLGCYGCAPVDCPIVMGCAGNG